LDGMERRCCLRRRISDFSFSYMMSIIYLFNVFRSGLFVQERDAAKESGLFIRWDGFEFSLRRAVR
jgi:hypothetical protein